MRMRLLFGVGCLISTLFISITAKAENFYLSQDVVELADKYATDDIPSELIQAVIWAESRGKPEATNGLNHGLMQLHEWYFTGDLYEPDNNVKQGAAYLQGLYDTYNHLPTILMVYHGESNAVSKGKSGNYSGYAQGIITMASEIEENRKCIASCGNVTEESENASTWKPEKYSTLTE